MPRQIISTTRPDGTRSTYTLQPGSSAPMQLEALKPLKPSRIKADRRAYPKYKPGMSTAEYVALYEAGNGGHLTCAGFWQPLNAAPAAGYAGIDTVEHGDFELSADVPATAPVAEVPSAYGPALAPALVVESSTLQAWQAAASRAGAEPAATAAEAEALAGASLARYGSTDPAACVHLASFSAWHTDTLQQLRAAAAPAAPVADADALAHNLGCLRTMHAELSRELQTARKSRARGAADRARALSDKLANVEAVASMAVRRLAELAPPAQANPDTVAALVASHERSETGAAALDRLALADGAYAERQPWDAFGRAAYAAQRAADCRAAAAHIRASIAPPPPVAADQAPTPAPVTADARAIEPPSDPTVARGMRLAADDARQLLHDGWPTLPGHVLALLRHRIDQAAASLALAPPDWPMSHAELAAAESRQATHWRPSSGQPSGKWRDWRDTPGGCTSGEDLSRAHGRPALFHTMAAAAARCARLNAAAACLTRPAGPDSLAGRPWGGAGPPATHRGFYTDTPATRRGHRPPASPAMTSKHYRWQTRWRLDPAAGTATHDTGLVVRFTAGRAQAVNGPDIEAALAVKNGPHNAPQMLRRLLKEAADLRTQAADHAAR